MIIKTFTATTAILSWVIVPVVIAVASNSATACPVLPSCTGEEIDTASTWVEKEYGRFYGNDESIEDLISILDNSFTCSITKAEIVKDFKLKK